MGTEKGTYSSRAPRVQSGKLYTCHSKLHEKPEAIRWTRAKYRLVKSNWCGKTGKLETEYTKPRSKNRLVWEGGTLYREQRFRPRERWDWIPSLTPPSWEPPLPPVLPTGGRGDEWQRTSMAWQALEWTQPSTAERDDYYYYNCTLMFYVF